MVLVMSDRPTKAKLGEPCTRCGSCCSKQLCAVAEMAFPEFTGPPCPLLQFEEGEAVCGLILVENHVFGGDRIKRCLGIGATGCGCQDD